MQFWSLLLTATIKEFAVKKLHVYFKRDEASFQLNVLSTSDVFYINLECYMKCYQSIYVVSQYYVGL